MRIYREWLGGSEEIDLSTEAGYNYFAYEVTQDDEAADEVIRQLRNSVTGEVVINTHDPVYIERYTVKES
jgi:hypothetical protein